MVRADITLAVVPSRGPAERQRLKDLALLLRVLLQEEQQELRAAVDGALDRCAYVLHDMAMLEVHLMLGR